MINRELSLDTVLSPACREIWDHSLLGVMILDREGIFRYMNRLFIMTDDLQDEDALGKPMVDFYPVAKDCHMSILAMESKAPSIKKTVIYYTRKRKLVNSLCSTFPLMHRGRVEGVIHFSLNLQMSQRLVERHKNGESNLISSDHLPRRESYTFSSIIGSTPQLKHAIGYARSAARTDFSVLVWAESGCGKELFAQAIHNASPRKTHPYVAINCAAIPDNLLETTLFGTVKGAFTGATNQAGLLEEAHGGTLLLDELNSMSLELQAKLLRAVQEKKIRRVGALKEIPVDVRFISTCNIPPAKALDENHIRADLFYRLGVVVLEIPPLRNRREDISLLCRHFLDQWRLEHGGRRIRISDGVLALFDRYPWPGNVRELEHSLNACLAMLQDESTIYEHHLSAYFLDSVERLAGEDPHASHPGKLYPAGHPSYPEKTVDRHALEKGPSIIEPGTGMPDTLHDNICLSTTLAGIETVYIERALKRSGYNVSKAGRFLNLSPQALRYRIKKLGIHVPVE